MQDVTKPKLKMGKKEALQATVNGGVAACIQAGLAVVIIFLAVGFNLQEGILSLFNDPVNLVAPCLFLVCGYGMYKQSRLASLLMVAFVLFNIIETIILTNRITGLITSVIFLYFYGKAIQGSFVFHRLEKANNPDYKSTPKWIVVTSAIVGLIMVSVTIFGYQLGDNDTKNNSTTMTIGELKSHINYSDIWNKKSIDGYNIFFKNMYFTSMKNNETLQPIDDAFLISHATKLGQCLTLNLIKTHTNPFELIEKIESKDAIVYNQMRQYKDLCMAED